MTQPRFAGENLVDTLDQYRISLKHAEATIRGLEAENARLREALSKLAKIGLAIRSAGPWTKRDAWPEFFDAVDEADALAEQAS